ncbi:MAG: carbamoyl-phosphate synthase large subunit [Crocinitomicaceae bacterium]|nr:carbamoyl-phosphate synthase large subunit [Crocinitomicaceae bacterium]
MLFIGHAFRIGLKLEEINKLTLYDPWFLKQIEEIISYEKKLLKIGPYPSKIDISYAKSIGFSDSRLATLLDLTTVEIRKFREKENIFPVYKRIDTCAAEFNSEASYLYSTYDISTEASNDCEANPSDLKKVIILGSGPNRIGQGIEFDYCCCHACFSLSEEKIETIMINCNPETVSTDFDTADKLYFEPVFWEHIYDIILHEKPEGVIVQLGGQTALKLAEKLDRYGIKVVGTTYQALDLAEDRGSFSSLLKDNNIPYPKFGVVESAEQAIELSKDLGFPLLVRPSYVLGGQKMKIVINEDELEHHVVDILRDMPDNKILLDHYLSGAIEAEADAICDGENVQIIGIMQHIEPAGIHSGDSYAVLPPFNLGDFIIQQIEEHTHKIALALDTVGLINIQFAIKDDTVYIIEANPRASRTVPFIAKAFDEPYVNYATKVMLGKKKIEDFNFQPKKNGYAIKIPVFSFDKFPNVNKELGPEMKSTGEAIRFIKDLKDPFFRKVYSERNLYLSK